MNRPDPTQTYLLIILTIPFVVRFSVRRHEGTQSRLRLYYQLGDGCSICPCLWKEIRTAVKMQQPRHDLHFVTVLSASGDIRQRGRAGRRRGRERAVQWGKQVCRCLTEMWVKLPKAQSPNEVSISQSSRPDPLKSLAALQGDILRKHNPSLLEGSNRSRLDDREPAFSPTAEIRHHGGGNKGNKNKNRCRKTQSRWI